MNSAAEISIPDAKQQGVADQFDLWEYWSIIYSNKWKIIGLAFVVSVLAVVAVFSITPVYRATATLLIESEQANVVSIEEVYGIDSSQREYYQTQFEILNSRKLAGRVIDELGISDHAEFNAADQQGLLSIESIPFVPPAASRTDDQIRQAVINRFMERLSIIPIRNTQLVDISFETTDPELAPRVANAIGNAYINSHLEARLELTQKASSWLTDRLAGMRDGLQEAERALRAFQERENLVDVSGVQTLTAKELDEQTRKLVEARKLTREARSQLDAAGESDSDYSRGWETLEGVLTDNLAQNLKKEEAAATKAFDEVRKRYGPKHPQYIAAESKVQSSQAAFQARVRNIVAGFEDRYRQALADQQDVELALEASKREIQDINRKSFELSRLQREVATNKQLYDLFFQRFQETNQTDFAAANARFVDFAERPYEPVKPRKSLIVAFVFVLGLASGALLAIARARLDNTIRVADELETKLGQSVLGVLPMVLKMPPSLTAAQLYKHGDFHSFQESVNSLRTSVVLSGIDSPQKVIVVTSSVPGEGKTTVSSNLSLALGQMERVILIDADMRRPSIATEYGFQQRTPGLAELVAATADGANCIHRMEDSGIDILTAGAIPPNPLDLLSSARFEELLARLSDRYDRIVIDSAPTQAVSDSLVLSTKADALIYVVKSDETSVNVVQNGIERLRKVHAPIIGTVLNKFDQNSVQKYGYHGSQNYGYYGYGYSSKGYQ